MGYWEVKLGGNWKSLGQVVGSACNDAKSRGAKQVKFKARGHEYVIDFDRNVQINKTSGKERPVRDKGGGHGGHHGGGGGGVTVHNPSALWLFD